MWQEVACHDIKGVWEERHQVPSDKEVFYTHCEIIPEVLRCEVQAMEYLAKKQCQRLQSSSVVLSKTCWKHRFFSHHHAGDTETRALSCMPALKSKCGKSLSHSLSTGHRDCPHSQVRIGCNGKAVGDFVGQEAPLFPPRPSPCCVHWHQQGPTHSALTDDLDQPLSFLGIPQTLWCSLPSVCGCVTQTGHSSMALMHAVMGSACSWLLAASSSLFQPLWTSLARSVKHPVQSLSPSFDLPCHIYTQICSPTASGKTHMTYQILSWNPYLSYKTSSHHPE